MNKLKFNDLATELKDGSIPLSILFDIVVKEIYYDIELDPFISCTLNDGNWIFTDSDSDGNVLALMINSNWSISFFCNDLPLHFNQYKLYDKLHEWNFLWAK